MVIVIDKIVDELNTAINIADNKEMRAEYGSNLIDRLVKDLKERYGVGFTIPMYTT